jgi:hypothetical protein
MTVKLGKILLLIYLVSGVFFFFKKKPEEAKFSGLITDVDRGCDSDGGCYIVVNNERILFEVGGMSVKAARGKIIGFKINTEINSYDTIIQSDINKKVEVFGRIRVRKDGSREVSIYGNKNYYIKKIQ